MSDDRQWVNAVYSGDTDAFAKIVRKYANALCSVAYGVLGDYHLAQDAAQEAFIKAYVQLDRLKEPEKIGSWLYAITYRLSLDWLRKRRSNDAPLEAVPSSSSSESAEDIALRRYDHEQVWDALRAMEANNRVTTVLYYMSGLSMKEIASFLGVSVRAVESRLQRAKKHLKSSLLSRIERQTWSA